MRISEILFMDIRDIKWPFVRTSFHDNIVSKLIDREIRLDEEINRLNQELASELNSHRDTKEKSQQRLDAYNCLFKELEEIKRYNENILNEANIQYEIFESSQQLNCDLKKELRETKDALSIAQDDLFKTKFNSIKAKEEISKVRGYLKTIAKKL